MPTAKQAWAKGRASPLRAALAAWRAVMAAMAHRQAVTPVMEEAAWMPEDTGKQGDGAGSRATAMASRGSRAVSMARQSEEEGLRVLRVGSRVPAAVLWQAWKVRHQEMAQGPERASLGRAEMAEHAGRVARAGQVTNEVRATASMQMAEAERATESAALMGMPDERVAQAAGKTLVPGAFAMTEARAIMPEGVDAWHWARTGGSAALTVERAEDGVRAAVIAQATGHRAQHVPRGAALPGMRAERMAQAAGKAAQLSVAPKPPKLPMMLAQVSQPLLAGNLTEAFPDDMAGRSLRAAIEPEAVRGVTMGAEAVKNLRESAAREVSLAYTQVTPQLTATFGDVRESADVNEMLALIETAAAQAMQSHLRMGGGGG